MKSCFFIINSVLAPPPKTNRQTPSRKGDKRNKNSLFFQRLTFTLVFIIPKLSKNFGVGGGGEKGLFLKQ